MSYLGVAFIAHDLKWAQHLLIGYFWKREQGFGRIKSPGVSLALGRNLWNCPLFNQRPSTPVKLGKGII